jgi:hypothetical protein
MENIRPEADELSLTQTLDVLAQKKRTGPEYGPMRKGGKFLMIGEPDF